MSAAEIYITPATGNSLECRTAFPAVAAVAFASGFVAGFVTQSLKSLFH
jgi:hypothetical protein